jgi:hypothetical protein
MNPSLLLIFFGLGLILLGALRGERSASALRGLSAQASEQDVTQLTHESTQEEDMLTLLEREHDAIPEEKKTAPARPSSLNAQSKPMSAELVFTPERA